MSLHDLIRCATCGHPRHMHAERYSETAWPVFKGKALVYMECRGGCGCQGFLDPRAGLTMGAR